jgi:ribosome-associated translation inhibitor RaiA
MIGRGSRRLPNKESFKLIDLGNNVRRFGYWQDFINWQDAFRFPDRFLESKLSAEDDLQFEVEFEFPHYMQGKINEKKLNEFSMKETYYDLLDKNEKGKIAVDLSVDNHAIVIKEQCEDIYDAMEMINFIQDHIEYRLKQYTKCIAKSTPNYFKYLMETYNRQLRQTLRAMYEE